jgi:hypothetical protein
MALMTSSVGDRCASRGVFAQQRTKSADLLENFGYQLVAKAPRLRQLVH